MPLPRIQRGELWVVDLGYLRRTNDKRCFSASPKRFAVNHIQGLLFLDWLTMFDTIL